MTVFQQGGDSYDVSLLCMSTVGIILLISYVVFAYLVTHQGDFYQVRRWKAAIWAAGIAGSVIAFPIIVVLIFSLIAASANPREGTGFIEAVGAVMGLFFGGFTLLVPFLFMVTFGTYYQLKRWLDSDDILDKIWKDPHKGHKSPIQEL